MKNKKDIFYKGLLHDKWVYLLNDSYDLVDSLYSLNSNIDLLRNNGHKLVNLKKWQDETDDAFDISLY